MIAQFLMKNYQVHQEKRWPKEKPRKPKNADLSVLLLYNVQVTIGKMYFLLDEISGKLTSLNSLTLSHITVTEYTDGSVELLTNTIFQTANVSVPTIEERFF